VAANAEGEVADAAWQVVNFLTDDEGAASVASVSFGPMPTRPSASEDYLANWEARTEGSGVNFEDFGAYTVGGEYSYPWRLPVGFQPFSDAFNASLQRAFDGQATAEDILTEAQGIAEELMSE